MWQKKNRFLPLGDPFGVKVEEEEEPHNMVASFIVTINVSYISNFITCIFREKIEVGEIVS